MRFRYPAQDGLLNGSEERVVDIGIYDPTRAAFQIDSGCWLLDLGFQGRRGVVAAYLLVGYRELALIETGPASTIQNLLASVRQAGFDPGRITTALVTHIHLDHSGAAGVLAREFPGLQVYVHPIGLPHLVDPSRLVSSATRIYGERMDPLWGEVAGLPESSVHPLEDGGRLSVADHEIEVVFTPGHASHHVAFHDIESGAVFTGDVGGIRMPGTSYVCPPTPPPDLDPDAWRGSIQRLRSLNARRWCLTHYGQYDDPTRHLAELERNLDRFTELGLGAVQQGLPADDITAMIHHEMAAGLGDVPDGTLTNLEWATPSYMATLGFQRLAKIRAAGR